MKQFPHRLAETKNAPASRQAGRRSSLRMKYATLFLVSLLGIAGAGAVFENLPSQSRRAGPEAPLSENRQDGAEIYQLRCMSCHQANGGGVPGVFPPLTGTDWVTGDEEVLIRIILNGMTGEIKVDDYVYTGAMPPWGSFLSDEEMAALLTYIRTEWSNESDSVAAETVAEVRAAVADRQEPWTVAELEAIREANAKEAQAKKAPERKEK